jgi:hypothetical protein
MSMEKQFITSSGWALASEGAQWILQRKYRGQQKSVAFVRSTRDILARVLNEKGVAPETASELLETLPSTFTEWALRADRSVLGEVLPNSSS